MPQLKTTDLDLYGLLDISTTATSAEIKSAYRKKALSCHPDKNPDNPNAAKQFIQLSDVFAILSDEKARAAYDQTLKAKEAQKERTRHLDAKRRKLKEDLERREQEAKEKSTKSNRTEQNLINEAALQREIERLKKEGSRKLMEEQELMKEQIRAELKREVEKKPKFPTPAPQQSQPSRSSTNSANPSNSNQSSFADFEAAVLANLAKAAAEQKNS